MALLPAGLTSLAGTAADRILEGTVIGSFSWAGIAVRSRLGGWTDASDLPSMAGRTALVTGATSGIGLEIARSLARLDASVLIVGRDEGRGREAIDELGDGVEFLPGDLADFDSVRELAARVAERADRLDVLVHNAGALTRERRVAPSGMELTVATHLAGPFVLTNLLLPQLRAAAPGRVLTMSSGGMYTQRFDLGSLEMGEDGFDGRTAYARAKRAQVVLDQEWARRVPAEEVTFHTLHPGWVDTPGVEAGLPGFHRLMGPLLRRPAEGADTAVWLAATPAGRSTPPRFWHDRRARSRHKVPWTAGGDSGAALWDWLVARTGAGAG